MKLFIYFKNQGLPLGFCSRGRHFLKAHNHPTRYTVVSIINKPIYSLSFLLRSHHNTMPLFLFNLVKCKFDHFYIKTAKC